MIVKNRAHELRLLAGGVVLVAALALACAEVRAPSGGTPDKTPPKLLSSVPASGQIDVSGKPTIKIRFSEAVQPGTGPQVFISPRPVGKPRIKWHGSELSVTLPETLATNQTYVIQVSATTSDLRGNKLDSAIIVAFSTGKTIDSGTIAGKVTQNGAPAAGATLALYAISSDTVSMVYDSVNADYETISNQKGNFEFRFLPKRLFRLIAFSDKNRNERFNPKTEPFGLSDRPIDLGGPLDLTNLELNMATVDTALPQVLTALYTQSKVIKVKLSKEISLAYLKLHPDSVLLKDSATQAERYHLVAFAERLDSAALGLTLLFGDIADGTYALHLRYDSLRPALTAPRVVVKAAKDKEPPTILSWLPGEKPLFVPAVKVGLTFSEPIDSACPKPGSLVLIQNETDTIAVSSRWSDPFQLEIIPAKLRPGAKYRLDLFGAGIADLAGNVVADSLRSFRFSTLSEDSMGTVTGTIVVSIPGHEADPVVLQLQDTRRKAKYRWEGGSREFRIDVPAGKYLLSGFVDSDRDGVRSPGTLSPFRYAETTGNYPDTISVRARFETTGIEFQLK